MAWTTCSKPVLFTDIETYSSVDIKSAGAFRYMEAPDFEILLLAYAFDHDPVRVLDLNDPEDMQALEDVKQALNDPGVVKVAHNSAFERNAYRTAFDCYQPPEEWVDTMILCAYNGLPMSLDAAGAALNLPLQKIKEGVSLINYFCKPCKPTVANGGRTRNYPGHAPDKWQRFKVYAGRDVDTMREIYDRLKCYPVTDFERQVWAMDARINERGVLCDPELVESAVYIDDMLRAENEAELKQITGLENPNSVSQLKAWLAGAGVDTDSLSKGTIAELLAQPMDRRVRRVLELRQALGKTSTAKYRTMTAAACADNRIRGITQYYGAVRTGRWAGRLVQTQNLPQNHLENIGEVREIVKARDGATMSLLFDSVPDALSQLIRTALIAKPGHTFLVADYSAIEARVIAYLAGEQWRMDVFANGGDIYCSSASQMFKVPVVKHGINGHLRQKGKIAELACGYGGGIGALKNFGADKMGLSEEEMQTIVDQWRAASPNIPRLWRAVEEKAKMALAHPGSKYQVSQKVYDPARARENERAMGAEAGSYSDFFNGGVVCTYKRDRDGLRCRLPSGRILTYWGADLDEDGSIIFMGQNQTTRQWEKTSTWGGKLVENIVQAYARDCLATAMVRLEQEGWHIVFHVHDEVIVEAPEDRSWEAVAEVMGRPIPWAPGLILRGDGYNTKFYMKD